MTENEENQISDIHTLKINRQSYIGSVLGGCKIESVLGVGGNGIVFLAHDQTLDRKVAIKLFPFGKAAHKDKTTRFIREAKAIAKIDHPNIVKIHSVGQEDDFCYIVMQYIKGKTLDDFIKEHKKLSLLDSLYITLQIAHALETIHQVNMIHRDIKPSNVIIDEKDRVWVMDFGLVRTNSEDETMITQTGVYQGTPAYSSPEQCATTSIDSRSDLYSLGVMFYEMLAGKVPHQAETPLTLMKKIVSEEPPPIENLNPEVPENIIFILQRLLEKDPVDRYPSATELVEDLSNAIQTVESDPQQFSKATLKISSSLLLYKTRKDSKNFPVKNLLKLVAGFIILGLVVYGTVYMIGTIKDNRENQIHENSNMLTMAIYDFGNQTKNKDLTWLELGIPDMLMSSLAQYPDLNIINRNQVLWSSQKNNVRFDGRFKDKLIPMGTNIVVQGNIYQSNQDVRIVLHIYDFKKNSSLGSITEQGSIKNVFAIIDKLTGDLKGFLTQNMLLKPERSNQLLAKNGVKIASIQPAENLFKQKLIIPAKGARSLRRLESKPQLKAPEVRESITGNSLVLDEKMDDSLGKEIAKSEIKEMKIVLEKKRLDDKESVSNLPSKALDTSEMADYDKITQKKKDNISNEVSRSKGKSEHKTKKNAPGLLFEGNLSTQTIKSRKVTDLSRVIPYYYKGIQLLEKQNLSKKEFDQQTQKLKAILQKNESGMDQLKQNYQNWEKKLNSSLQ